MITYGDDGEVKSPAILIKIDCKTYMFRLVAFIRLVQLIQLQEVYHCDWSQNNTTIDVSICRFVSSFQSHHKFSLFRLHKSHTHKKRRALFNFFHLGFFSFGRETPSLMVSLSLQMPVLVSLLTYVCTSKSVMCLCCLWPTKTMVRLYLKRWDGRECLQGNCIHLWNDEQLNAGHTVC